MGVLGGSIKARRRYALGPPTLHVVNLACHFTLSMLLKNAACCSECVALVIDTEYTALVEWYRWEDGSMGSKRQSHCYFGHHKSDKDRHCSEPKPLEWQAGNKLPRPWHGQGCLIIRWQGMTVTSCYCMVWDTSKQTALVAPSMLGC
jgi:hypothetical protein